MKPVPLLAAAFALAVAVPEPAEAAPSPDVRGAALRLPAVESWRLANGLEVVFSPRPGSPVASVQVWYRVGSVDDPPGKRGLARLFESLMFEGSARLRPGDHRAYLERVGGQASAEVSDDVSAFADTVPADRLELALELEAERMRGLELGVDAVARAVAQAQSQLAQQVGSPLWRGFRRLLSTAFVQHPYGHTLAPPPAELAAIGAADARAFYDAYYRPGNALLVVVGGVERAAVQAAIERRFAGIPATAAPPPRPAAELVEPPQSARRREEEPGADGLVMLGFHVPAARDSAVHDFQLLGQILTGGRGSRLGGLVAAGRAIDVAGQVMVRRDPGLMMVYAVAQRGAPIEALEKALDEGIAGLARRGPTAAELARARKQIASTVLATAQRASGFANQLGVAWALTGEPARLEADLAALVAVPAAAVKRAAARGLASDRASVVIGKPAAAGGRR